MRTNYQEENSLKLFNVDYICKKQKHLCEKQYLIHYR